ncbi:hypothetical protein QTN24_15485 [Cupriavidus sp. SZY C1]|uniref:hypothetical protein n=1 Tax=Cupriavidus sp. SZY C1 TaxID=3055037 RepID=UPI0028B4E73B|nr:hypothetical protein [Cupriavidus sp. SZY C1]MDT6962902.1 hypothetical protein [Cupriavidus sp. SZY C1]
MKKLPLLLALFANAVLAQTAYVTPPGTRKEGDTIDRSHFIYVLHESEPCGLPIVNARHMRKAEIYNTRKPDIGCWGGTLSASKGSVVIIGPQGNTSARNLVDFSKVNFRPDGSVVIIEGWPGL